MNCKVTGPRASHRAHRADRQRVLGPVRIRCRPRIGQRYRGLREKCIQLRDRVGGPDAASDQQDGTLGPAQGGCHVLHILDTELRGRVAPGFRRYELLALLRVDPHALNVERNVDPHRPLPARLGQVEGLPQLVHDHLRVGDHHRVLGHRFDDGDDVRLLLAVGAQGYASVARGFAQGVLTGDEHAGDAVLPGAEHTRDGISSRAPGGDEAGAGLTRVLCMGDCGIGRCLLVVNRDPLEFLQPCDRIGQEEGTATRDHEHVVDALGMQPLHHVVSNASHKFIAPSCRHPCEGRA